MTLIRLTVIGLTLLVLAACGGGDDDGAATGNPGGVSGSPSSSDNSALTDERFTLSVSPQRKAVAQGGSVILNVQVKTQSATTAQPRPNLRVTGSPLLADENDAPKDPEGVIGYYFKAVDDRDFTLTFDIGKNVSPGSYDISIIADTGNYNDRSDVTIDITRYTPPTNYGIVYVRVPRATEMIKVDDELLDPSFLDTLPEVHHVLDTFNAPGQLVWRDKDGKDTVIFDCVNGMPAEGVVPPQQNGDDTCVPMDPSVSFDGKKVAFAVYHGKYLKKRFISGPPQSNGEVGQLTPATWAGIYIYDFESGKLTAWPHQDGVWDTAPVWLPGGKMMFTSTRSGTYSRHITGKPGPVLQLWIADQDGADAHSVGTQEQQSALHPFVHSSGRVLFSSHQTPLFRDYYHYGKRETTPNLWWLMSVDRRGGDLNAHLHAHESYLYPNYSMTLTALHFIGELSDQQVCVDMYYRRNNFGAGNILCWPTKGANRSPLGHEGAYPFDAPEGMYVAVAGDSGDSGGIGPHVRDPAGVPEGGLLFAGGIGPDSNCHFGNLKPMIAWTQSGLTCDIGIYLASGDQLPLTGDDSAATLVVNDPHWHEFMPKPVLAYKTIHKIPEPNTPTLINTDTGDPAYGVFASANAYIGDLRSKQPWDGPANGYWCHFQGCAIQSLVGPLRDDAGNLRNNNTEITAVRFWEVLPNTKSDGSTGPMYSVWGQRLRLMGDVPLEEDGSFKARLPANVPFLMSGVDVEGRSIERHQAVMSLRPGEKQVCSGCHLHSSKDGDSPRFDNTRTAYNGSAEKPSGGRTRPLEWKADIQPILSEQCSECHSAGLPPDFSASEDALYAELTNNLVPNYEHTDDGKTRSAVPWLTRYVNGLFARESLLYWMAAGQRLDGRTNDTRTDDFDFHHDHVGAKYNLDPSQLRLLADWIEEGLYRCHPNTDDCADTK